MFFKTWGIKPFLSFHSFIIDVSFCSFFMDVLRFFGVFISFMSFINGSCCIIFIVDIVGIQLLWLGAFFRTVSSNTASYVISSFSSAGSGTSSISSPPCRKILRPHSPYNCVLLSSAAPSTSSSSSWRSSGSSPETP